MIANVLVELDMLLDTRISTVSLINEAAAVDLLNDKYRNRDHDDLGEFTDKITTADFRKAYRTRDVMSLVKARPTPMAFVFGMSMQKKVEEVKATAKYNQVRVDINVYPYELTDEEKVAMVESVMAYIKAEVFVSVVSYPIFELTLSKIKAQNYAAIYMYHFVDWAETHIEKLTEKDPMLPSVQLIIPELVYKSGLKTDATVVEGDNGKKLTLTPFQALRMMMAPIMAVQFVPTELVSIMELPPDVFAQENQNGTESDTDRKP
jgi:hypothetical protein